MSSYFNILEDFMTIIVLFLTAYRNNYHNDFFQLYLSIPLSNAHSSISAFSFTLILIALWFFLFINQNISIVISHMEIRSPKMSQFTLVSKYHYLSKYHYWSKLFDIRYQFEIPNFQNRLTFRA